MQQPKITENYTPVGVNVARIVRRILAHLPPEVTADLHEIRILDSSERGFGCYKSREGVIELYVAEMIGYLPPIFLNMFYPLTYMFIGMTLGHELDHHVKRNKKDIDRVEREASAEANVMKYIYPSFGVFKPFIRIIIFFGGLFGKLSNHRTKTLGTG